MSSCGGCWRRSPRLKVGSGDDDDFGPVINERQLNMILAAIEQARRDGATRAGRRTPRHVGNARRRLLHRADAPRERSIRRTTCRRRNCSARWPASTACAISTSALALANDSPYGLTACIHTRNFDRALAFVDRVEAGVVIVNAGTFGSEPHMPFGGVKQSGNGTREPGTEALDVYSTLKDVYLNVNGRRV